MKRTPHDQERTEQPESRKLIRQAGGWHGGKVFAAPRQTAPRQDPPAGANGTPLPDGLLDRVDVLVSNQTELAALASHAGPVDAEAAAALARRKPRIKQS